MAVVGVDYGRKRTGLAVFIHGMVLPLEPVTGPWSSILGRIEELMDRYGESCIVMGLPLSALGKPTELSREVEEFAEQLRSKGLEVSLVNEARSSKEAFHLTGKKDRKGHADSVAACEILKRYLNIL